MNSVRNHWNEYDDDINRALESDKFIDSYLQDNNQPIPDLPLESKTISDAVERDKVIQSYLGVAGPCIHEVLDCAKEVNDIAMQSDAFLQSYLDGDKNVENKFQKKSKLIKDAKESDILLEKYLLS